MRPLFALTLATSLTFAATPAFAEGASPVKLSGFIDTSLFVPLTGFPDGDKGVALGLDQVELDIEAQLLAGLKMRADLNYFPAAGPATFDGIVEQGFIEVGFKNGLFLIAGKTNAPIGVEAVDAPDMYQFSHSLLFDLASPTNLTGFFLGWANDMLKFMVWVTNDWDTPSTQANASAGGRVEVGLGDGAVGLSSTYGPLKDDDPKLMLDLDFAMALGLLKVFAEGNYGKLGDLSSVGFSAKGNIDLGGGMSATARLSWLDREFGDVYKGMEVTGAFLFTIVDNLAGLVEIRADMPDGGDTRVGAAAELTGTF